MCRSMSLRRQPKPMKMSAAIHIICISVMLLSFSTQTALAFTSHTHRHRLSYRSSFLTVKPLATTISQRHSQLPRSTTHLSLQNPFTKEADEAQAQALNNSITNTPKGPTIVIETTPEDQIYSAAITRTLLWILAATLFGLSLFLLQGEDVAAQFFAGYIVEQSLSLDNLFVFLLLFDYFKVPLSSQDRVLNWGIYGAVVMRAGMIGIGSVALREFHGILLVFAGILIYSSYSALAEAISNFNEDDNDDDGEEKEDMGENKIVQFSRNLLDASDTFDGDRFFTIEEGVKRATPLLICMVAVEISDVVFAVDSIPAVFGVTENPLIVFSSNMFAIMGLRSLYTILSKAAQDLEYLEPAVAFVLGFIGVKLVAEYFGIVISTELSLGVVLTFLSAGVGLSVYSKNTNK